MLIVNQGEIWRALVPFNDGVLSAKERPALVLGYSSMTPLDDAVVLLCPITSFGRGGRPQWGDVYISDPASQTGLSRPSHVRSRRIWGAAPAAFRSASAIGTLSQAVVDQVMGEISNML